MTTDDVRHLCNAAINVHILTGKHPVSTLERWLSLVKVGDNEKSYILECATTILNDKSESYSYSRVL